MSDKFLFSAQVETSAFMECRNVLGNVLQLKCTDAKVLHAISRARPSSAVDGAFISSKVFALVRTFPVRID